MSIRCTSATSVLLLTSLLAVGCGSPEEREARYIKLGNEYFDQGEYEKARVEYKNAARIKPADAEVAWRFGLVDEAENDFPAAFADFTRAEQQDGHFHPAILKLAEFYLAAGREDEARQRIDAVLADRPDDPDAHALRAALWLQQKDYAGTEKEARTALGKNPADAIAFLVLAGLYAAEGDKAKALATAEEGAGRNPHDVQLLLLRSKFYEQAGLIDKMAESYQAVFHLAPAEAQYRVDLAAAYLKAGRIDDAETALRAGVAALPEDWEMKRELVTFLGDRRGIDSAEKEIRSLLQAYPYKSEPSAWLVDLYLHHGLVDRAVSFLDEIIARQKFDRQGIDARTALARIDYSGGDKIAAGKLAQSVLEKEPDNPDALFVKARIENDAGLYQDAVVALRTVLRDRPKTGEALHLLSETLLRQGHPDLAVDTMAQLVAIDPLNFAARVRLAEMVHLNGDSRHALELLASVTSTNPQYAVAWESTARVAIDIKDWPTAETAIRNLEALQGQHVTAVFLRGRMMAGTGKMEEAIAQYKQVIDADPSSPLAGTASTALVNAYRSLGRVEEATRYLANLKTGSPAVRTLLGESHLASGDSRAAAVDFDAAIAADGSLPEPYLARARMYLLDGKTDQALDMLKKAVAAAPGDLRAPMMEAQILGETGHAREAIALYEDLLGRNPDLDEVVNNLAEIIADYDYEDPVALDKALQITRRFTAASNPLYLDTLAWVYYRQGKIDEARSLMERIFAAGVILPPQVHYHYGVILLKSGRNQEARTELQQSIVNGARYPGLDEAQKMLAAL